MAFNWLAAAAAVALGLVSAMPAHATIGGATPVTAAR